MSTLAADPARAARTARAAYRDYDKPGIDRVREFYRNNHRQQTVAFVSPVSTVPAAGPAAESAAVVG